MSEYDDKIESFDWSMVETELGGDGFTDRQADELMEKAAEILSIFPCLFGNLLRLSPDLFERINDSNETHYRFCVPFAAMEMFWHGGDPIVELNKLNFNPVTMELPLNKGHRIITSPLRATVMVDGLQVVEYVFFEVFKPLMQRWCRPAGI